MNSKPKYSLYVSLVAVEELDSVQPKLTGKLFFDDSSIPPVNLSYFQIQGESLEEVLEQLFHNGKAVLEAKSK